MPQIEIGKVKPECLYPLPALEDANRRKLGVSKFKSRRIQIEAKAPSQAHNERTRACQRADLMRQLLPEFFQRIATGTEGTDMARNKKGQTLPSFGPEKKGPECARSPE